MRDGGDGGVRRPDAAPHPISSIPTERVLARQRAK